MGLTIRDLEELLQLLETNPEWLRALQDRIVDEQAILRLLSQRAEVREAIRRYLLQDELLELPALLSEIATLQHRQESILQSQNEQLSQLIEIARRHESILQEHTRALQHHTEQLTELAEIARRHESILQEHTAYLIRLDQRSQGEAGQRAGERYENRTVRRAFLLMRGGSGGGTDQPEVQQRLRQWLASIEPDLLLGDEESDPTLADLIWWKGNRVVVAEVSLKLDPSDVRRAKKRATTLQQAGVQAIPLVIGEEWVHAQVREIAQQQGVEWYLPGDMSAGFLAFRNLPADRD